MTDVLDKIATLDLQVVRQKLVMAPEAGGYGWPEQETDDAIERYRAFLKDVYASRRQRDAAGGGEAEAGMQELAPDPVTDIVWHTHILFTEKYHRDCDALFGEYIHHRPVVEDGVSSDRPPAGA